MTTTRAKFRCLAVTHHEGGSCTVKLMAVYSGDIHNENHRFQKATPNGTLEMSLSHNSGFFEPGKSYYLDFSEADVKQVVVPDSDGGL